ncbi:MAG: HEPN domain-containing protein [Chromatiaceae bacterium]|nr:HEPN domain-containing protein [Chromatiaceae bacterium]
MGKTEVEPGMPLNEIVKNLRQKYDDALLLTQHQRYANAIYLSGYCVELALKYAVTKHLNWQTFRTAGNLKALKTHNFLFLLQLTGKEKAIKELAAWNVVSKWHETKRYEDPRSAKETDATSMLSATQTLVKALCEISL